MLHFKSGSPTCIIICLVDCFTIFIFWIFFTSIFVSLLFWPIFPSEWKDAAIPLNDEGKALWFGDKKTNMGLDFPNLPYLIDGDVKVTQSVAVYRHLGKGSFVTRWTFFFASFLVSLKVENLEFRLYELRIFSSQLFFSPGRKFDLYPDLADQSRGDMFEQYIMDLRSGITKLCFQAGMFSSAKLLCCRPQRFVPFFFFEK